MNKKKFVITVFILLLVVYVCFLVFRLIQYQPDTYVCRHMARDQEIMLERQGLDVKICRGTTRIGGEGHAWVAIDYSGNLVHMDSIGWYPFIPEFLYYDIEIFDNYEEYMISKQT